MPEFAFSLIIFVFTLSLTTALKPRRDFWSNHERIETF